MIHHPTIKMPVENKLSFPPCRRCLDTSSSDYEAGIDDNSNSTAQQQQQQQQTEEGEYKACLVAQATNDNFAGQVCRAAAACSTSSCRVEVEAGV
jgi:hypothetical protein